MSSDEASYFLNIAVIGGTLLALSFVTLQFFLGELLKRFESTALPVFRSRDFDGAAQPPDSLTLPHSLKDIKLFDGDPLVIFIAFSVAVTWIQFLIPLTLGLTAAWLGWRPAVLAGELAGLLSAFAFSFLTRDKAIKRLQPYLTREELLWPVFGGILLALYVVAAVAGVISALSTAIPVTRYLAIWNRWGTSDEHALLFLLKAVCVLSLLAGTYTTNKDMFIFFKSTAAERMRQRWLDSFVGDRYDNLKNRVESALRLHRGAAGVHPLKQKWNNGCPNLKSTHAALSEGGQESLRIVWQEVIERRSGAPSWMLDVPAIASWEARIEESLKACNSAASVSGGSQGHGNISPPESAKTR